MNKRFTWLGLILPTLLTTLVACSDNDPPPTPPVMVVRSAILTGAQESPPTPSAATGRGAVVVNPVTREITGGITFTGVTPTVGGHHIHRAPAGNAAGNGPVIVPLVLAPGGGVATIAAGTILTEDQYASLLAGELYFNVHSVAFPAGEIRGQITIVGGVTAAIARLTPAQEVPPVTSSTASGLGTIVFDATTRAIIIAYVTHNVANDNNAHIHTGAIGVHGPANIVNPFTRGTGVWTVPSPTPAPLTAQQVTDINSGNAYFNVHSVAFPGGEIRGQLCDTVLVATCR